tara:strand:- start:149 stop:730 length:582 start_codon:yes stop_codon:yes gene_type:complete
MSYNLKDVFYLSAQHTYAHGTFGSAGVESAQPIDVSAYVDPIAKGRTKGQGLAVYKVHAQISKDTTGSNQIASDVGGLNYGLTVKPFTTSGDDITGVGAPDLTTASDLAIYLGSYTSPASGVAGQACNPTGNMILEPSAEVPYVVVRDTIFMIAETFIGMSSADSMVASYRMECAMVTLDQSTLNQLLRTQTA